jgi:hypothetical protein
MAKKINNSPFHKKGVDPVTELLIGVDGAVRLEECRIVLNGGRTVKVGEHTINKIGIYGSILTDKDIVQGDEEFQMWECEVIIIPRKKFRQGFRGYRSDQVLACDFSNPEKWKEQIL